MTGKLVVFCTCGSLDEARKIARSVVEMQLAACVNIVPAVHSIYRWQGEVEEADEILLVMKTRDLVYPHLEAEVRRLHSYAVPEIIAIPIDQGFPPYLDWINSETRAIQ